MNMQFLRRGITARPAKDLKVRSSLVRRLVQAQDDPAKHRIRAWLCDLNDEQLSSLVCTSEDIAVLRGTANAELEATEAIAKQPAALAAPRERSAIQNVSRRQTNDASPTYNIRPSATYLISRHGQRREGNQ